MKYLNIVMVSVAALVVAYTFSETFLRSGVSGAALVQVEALPVERSPARVVRPGPVPGERPASPGTLPGTLGIGGGRTAGSSTAVEVGESVGRSREGVAGRVPSSPVGAGEGGVGRTPVTAGQGGAHFTAPTTTSRPEVSVPRSAGSQPSSPAAGPSRSLLPPPLAEVLQDRSVRPPVDGTKREGDPPPPPIRSSMPNRRPPR